MGRGTNEQFSHIVDVQAVAHAGISVSLLDHRDIAVAIVVARYCTVQYAERDNLAAFKLNNFVPVLRFSSVSIMHQSSLRKSSASRNRSLKVRPVSMG